MKKEKSKVFFDILLAATSLFLTFGILIQFFKDSCKDEIDYREKQMIMKSIYSSSEESFAHFIKIEKKLGILENGVTLHDGRVTSDAFWTNCIQRSAIRNKHFMDGFSKYGEETISLSRKFRILGLLSYSCFGLAFGLNIIAITWGHDIHKLYKT